MKKLIMIGLIALMGCSQKPTKSEYEKVIEVCVNSQNQWDVNSGSDAVDCDNRADERAKFYNTTK